MIKFLLFDFDGVLDQNYDLHFKLCARKFLNLTKKEHKEQFDGNVHIEREKMKDRDTGFDFLKCLSDSRKDRKIEENTKNVLNKLAQNYKLGIISSCHEYGIKNFLENNGLSRIFSFVYGLETNKLKTLKFEKVLKEFNLEKKECLFVTDTLGDILEANEIGIKTVAVDFGYHDRRRLEKGKPYKIISDFKEIEDILSSI